MKLSNLFGPLTAFAFAVLLVVGATAGVAVVVDDSSNSPTQSNAQPFQTESLLPEPVSAEGTVTPPETTTQKTVVVDLSHGNDVSRTDIQPLVSALVSAGHEVRFFAGSSSSFGMSGSAGSELNTTLGEADAFVVVNPASSYSTEEVDGIEAFADAGGRVLLLADTPTQSGGSTAVIPGLSGSTTQSASGQPTNVAGRFGITFGAGYLYDMTENANNFQYVYGSASSDDDIATGSQQTVFREAVPLVTRSEVTTVLAADDVRRSSTRKNGTHAVVARNENVVAVGDTWFLSPEAATLADNEQLVGNIASFLVTGDKTPGVPSTQTTTATAPSFGGSQGTGAVTVPTSATTDTPGNATTTAG